MQCETTKARKTPLGTRSARHSQRSVAQAFLSFTFMVRASGNSLSYEVPVANQTARPISSMQAQGINVYSAVRRSASQRLAARDSTRWLHLRRNGSTSAVVCVEKTSAARTLTFGWLVEWR